MKALYRGDDKAYPVGSSEITRVLIRDRSVRVGKHMTMGAQNRDTERFEDAGFQDRGHKLQMHVAAGEQKRQGNRFSS